MEESVDLHEEAGKENEQTLANLSLNEEATSKHEVEIETFLQEQKWKNTQYKTKSDLNALEKFCESLKESRAIWKHTCRWARPSFVQIFHLRS